MELMYKFMKKLAKKTFLFLELKCQKLKALNIRCLLPVQKTIYLHNWKKLFKLSELELLGKNNC